MTMPTRMLCFKCSASLTIREQLWRLIQSRDGFLSDRLTHMLFWIPEQCADFALLIDPTLERLVRQDYIL